MGMFGRIKLTNFILLAIILSVFGGCDAVDTIWYSSGTYRVSVHVDGVPLDNCSFVTIDHKISPYFETSVSRDPDITSLIVLLKGTAAKNEEEELEMMIVYSLETETEEYEDAIEVESLDDLLPVFTMPEEWPMGQYSLIFQIMSGQDILQKLEKKFFYLADTAFSFNDISVYLPGITENRHIVSKGMSVMLEANADFDRILDPYIVWYSGRSIISEGYYSEGAENIFWIAPEQSNFYSLRAEIFPVKIDDNIAGFQREVSILVSSQAVELNLISEDIPELEYWYIFDGSLNDNKFPFEHRVINPHGSNKPVWKSADGVYGLATGFDNVFTLPDIDVIEEEANVWQLLFRFMPIGEDFYKILSVNFDGNSNAKIELSVFHKSLYLSLSSSLGEVIRIYSLPPDSGSFVTAGIIFSVEPELISAKVNIIGQNIETGELALEPLMQEVNAGENFQILLGQISNGMNTVNQINIVNVDNIDNVENSSLRRTTEQTDEDDAVSLFDNENDDEEEFIEPKIIIAESSIVQNLMTAIWDEFAVYYNPSMETIAAEITVIPIGVQSEEE